MKHKNQKQHRIMIILAVALLAMHAICGCTVARNQVNEPVTEPDPGPIDGGVTNRTDADAPKFIESKEICDFDATFCLYGEWSEGNSTCFYTFAIKPESGELTASESTTGVSAKADDELLGALQQIIDEQELVKLNGTYEVTAGLPPEFWPCTLNVNYESGENLTFTYDNDPDAEWAKEMYLAFADWFEKQGKDDLIPPSSPVSPVTNVMIEFEDPEDGTWYDYSIFEKDNGTPVICRSIGDGFQEITFEDPDGFFDEVNETVGRYDLRKYDERSVLCDYPRTEADLDNPFAASLQLTFWIGDDEQFSICTSDPAGIDELRPLVNELMACFDARFDTLPADGSKSESSEQESSESENPA